MDFVDGLLQPSGGTAFNCDLILSENDFNFVASLSALRRHYIPSSQKISFKLRLHVYVVYWLILAGYAVELCVKDK